MSNDQPPVMTPVARTAPCPCGSGKRFKECHGALAAERAPAPRLPAVMREALQAQREGRIVEAAERYRRVLAGEPANFDANHMLGLVAYEIGDYDEAVALLHRAIELRPDIGIARHNLRLLESLPGMEIEICREALARLVGRVDARFDPRRLADGGTVHVVSGFGEAERDALDAIMAACAPSPVTLWLEAGAKSSPPAAVRLTAAEHPRDGCLILLGAAASIAAWIEPMRAGATLIVATRDRPCDLVDRVDELAEAGYADPGLLCASPALARRLGLPLTAVLPSDPGTSARRDAA